MAMATAATSHRWRRGRAAGAGDSDGSFSTATPQR
jgi:hypothetical protein